MVFLQCQQLNEELGYHTLVLSSNPYADQLYAGDEVGKQFAKDHPNVIMDFHFAAGCSTEGMLEVVCKK